MSKEIDWNTVETVWDYESKIDRDIFTTLYKNTKKDYVEYLKKDEHSNMRRLLDIHFIFDYFVARILKGLRQNLKRTMIIFQKKILTAFCYLKEHQ